ETPVEELDRYDRVLVASRRYAKELRGPVRPPVEPLLQFTDPLLFHPAPTSENGHPVTFVGNWRGEFRRIVWDAIEAGHPPALYGRGWDLLAPEHFVAEHVPHAELHELYSSCDVVLCDHWDDMRRHGFVSNRVFDALACEAFVLADDNPAIAAELPGAVETYRDPADLRRKLDRCLADPDRRREMARRGRALVLAGHTVERRVEELLRIVATARVRDGRAAGGSAGPAGARAGGAGGA
ncbi:MAG TPA: glycosyltransferase, partial [Solirubrobacterales bacterium]|nr:glycosyltransferase [Solirubrobacterales bacterium]